MRATTSQVDVLPGAVPLDPIGPRGNLILGHVGSIERDALGFLERCHREYGDVVRLRFFIWPAVLLVHPDHVKHVLQDRHAAYDKNTMDWRMLRPVLGESLLTSDGDTWLAQRRLMQPAFHRDRIAAFGELMVEQTVAMLQRWEPAARAGDTLDVAAEMSRVTLDIVTRALFGAVVKADADVVGEAVTSLNRQFLEDGFTLQGLIAMFTGRPTRSARRSLALLHGIMNDIIAARRTASEPGSDLLSLLLAARDEETGAGMDDAQLRDQVLTLFVAGHETTSNALAWTWSLLARNPEATACLHDELARTLGGRLPTVADLPQLTYTRMVLDEAMRLYPPAWATSRNATEEDEIGGYRVRKGSLVALSPWLTHRHPGIWPDPLVFRPERFAPEAVAARPKFSYYPFGGGPHLCIGNSFAIHEAVLVLATVSQRYALTLADSRPVEPEPMVTLRPRGGLPMKLVAR
ncbi:MAG: cytochrome P450 [Myxococcales bacterium]|jgi:cytochrome P450|nr:MAG: cytochrome P450 [Myxococcales bacterium]